MMFTQVKQLAELLQQKKWQLVTAESCTGGGVAEMLTRVPGSSAWFERGFVTYSNTAKQEMLGVANVIIEQQGAVSEQTVIAMAQGALQHSHAQVSLAVTGIAGPDGGTPDKPVGTVWFAWADMTQYCISKRCFFKGDRQHIRAQAIAFALSQLEAFIRRK